MSKLKIISLFFLLICLVSPAGLSAGENAKTEVNSYLKATAEMLNHNLDSALILTRKAYEIALNSGNDTLLYRTNSAFVEIYSRAGNDVLTIEYANKALEFLEKIPVENLNAKEYNNLVSFYSRLGNSFTTLVMYDMARYFYYQTQNVVKQSREKLPDLFPAAHEASILFNLGSIYLMELKTDSAKIIFDEIERINEQLNDRQIRLHLLNNRGIYYKEKGMMDMAYKSYAEALVLARESNDKTMIAKANNNLGQIYADRKKPDAAIACFLLALQAAKEASEWSSVVIAASSLSEQYVVKNDFLNAHLHLNMALKIKDSLFTNERARNLQQHSLQYKTDKEVRALEFENTIRLRHQSQLKFLFMQILVVLLLLLVIAVFFAFNRSKQSKLVLLEKNIHELESLQQKQKNLALTKEVDIKSRELAEKAMYIVQKNEFISQITQRLLLLSQKLPSEIAQIVQQLITDIQRDTDDKIWNEFEHRFRDVHEDFYKALNLRFPDLTPNEKKLAAFLRLNLTTKDISSITYQSPDSIKIARSRLRKKLGISQQDNLVSFLESIV